MLLICRYSTTIRPLFCRWFAAIFSVILVAIFQISCYRIDMILPILSKNYPTKGSGSGNLAKNLRRHLASNQGNDPVSPAGENLVLLGHQHWHALRLERQQRLGDGLHQHWRDAFTGFVEQ